jgi:imidazoleglycerol phosphate synthase glutamine amidotransferase subunit HisH
MPTVHLLDYVAGNIRSLVNAIEKVGYTVEWIRSPEDVVKAEVSLLFGHVKTLRFLESYLWSVANISGARNLYYLGLATLDTV